jgi:aminopeptidase C
MVRDMWRVNEKNFRFERYAVFYFEKQEHANWFILRWS